MKNTNLRNLAVALVSIFAFSGLPNGTVEAITKLEIEKEDTFLDTARQYGVNINEINQENRDIAQKSDNLKEQEIKLASPKEIQTSKKIVPESTPNAVKQKRATNSISKKERDLIARLVEAEAKGEPYEGKVAVATVVLNRVDSPHFPNKITAVIKQKVGGAFAFSPVQNGEINSPASPESKKAVNDALTRNNRLSNSIYFYNPETATDNWIRTRKVVKTIGNHVFAK